jgi:hypothetical protein
MPTDSDGAKRGCKTRELHERRVELHERRVELHERAAEAERLLIERTEAEAACTEAQAQARSSRSELEEYDLASASRARGPREGEVAGASECI